MARSCIPKCVISYKQRPALTVFSSIMNSVSRDNPNYHTNLPPHLKHFTIHASAKIFVPSTHDITATQEGININENMGNGVIRSSGSAQNYSTMSYLKQGSKYTVNTRNSFLNPNAMSFEPRILSNLNPSATSFVPGLGNFVIVMSKSFYKLDPCASVFLPQKESESSQKRPADSNMFHNSFLNDCDNHGENYTFVEQPVNTAPFAHVMSSPVFSNSSINEGIFSTSVMSSENVDIRGESEVINPVNILKKIKLSNVNRLVIGHININSLRNKFESLKMLIIGNIDILVITESKLDESFTTQQFAIEGYLLPYRIDRNENAGGGVIIYVREDIPCRELITFSENSNMEGIFLEINLRKTKWLIFGGYNNNKLNIDIFLGKLGPILEQFISKYDNFLLL